MTVTKIGGLNLEDRVLAEEVFTALTEAHETFRGAK
jgi:hypothetical protein